MFVGDFQTADYLASLGLTGGDKNMYNAGQFYMTKATEIS
jgi:hypothetical protein